MKEQLKELLGAVDFGSPQRARNLLNDYWNTPDYVRDLWIRGELYDGHVKQLTQIHRQLEKGKSLENSSTKARGHEYDDLVEYSRKEYEGTDDYYIRKELRAIKKEIKNPSDQTEDDDGPENPESTDGPDEPEDADVPKDEFDEFTQNQVTDQDEVWAQEVADYRDTSKTAILEQCFEKHEEGDDWQSELKEATEEIAQEYAELQQERIEAVEKFDFDSDSTRATGEADHLAPPIETDNLGVYFHDAKERDDEIADQEVQLVFTSPPYFTQSDRIIERWWPENVEYDEENITEETVDQAYQNYLEEMTVIFEKAVSKLDEGRYMVLDVSDVKAYELDKVYDIPSDLSYILRNQLGLRYDATITWDKGEGQRFDRNPFFQNGDGKPGTYHPNWRCERLLVFSKCSPSMDTEFKHDDANHFQKVSDDIWPISNKTHHDSHEAGYTVNLPIPVIQLYSAPGDTVLDPFGGYSTTLLAVKRLNDYFEDEPDWQGFAYENFASESGEQPDYRKRTKGLLDPDHQEILHRFRSYEGLLQSW
jgi:DNA modification methylase